MHRVRDLAAVVAIAIPNLALGQQSEMAPKDRCAQLLAYWDQRSASKGEGASGSDMARKAAGLDCDNRRYADGIKRMEDLLRQNRYPVPAPQP
ncbi:hypothetical protein [Reyranella soli]|uniref:Uncharacterized protein n=1 Tax=Reyranella soli TaxID=1230389 RepID=A0A512NHY6_9HYPH|nr:hypothetical protein [Reyranella soli]GEP58567.1 hypothetical protein RSO01_57330 [Reyranella soli]